MTQVVSYVTIGRLTRPHGIRGEICAQYYAQSLQYLEKGQAFIKTEKSAPKPLTLTSYKEQGNILILKIKNVNSRTEAEFLRNFDIVIDDTLLAYEDSDMSCANENILRSQMEDSNQSYPLRELAEEESFVTSAHMKNTKNDFEQAPFLYHLMGAKAYLCQKYIAENPFFKNTAQSNEIEEPYLGLIEDIIFPADQEIWLIKTDKNEEILFPAVSQFLDRYDLSDLENVKVYLYPPSGLLEIYLQSGKD